MQDLTRQISNVIHGQEKLAGCLEAAELDNSRLENSLQREWETAGRVQVMHAFVVTSCI